jgi:hypothetical protein
MSKMTQRRMNRRAARRQARLRRENRSLVERIGWLSSNLEGAFRAIKAMRDRTASAAPIAAT